MGRQGYKGMFSLNALGSLVCVCTSSHSPIATCFCEPLDASDFDLLLATRMMTSVGVGVVGDRSVGVVDLRYPVIL